jgi:hypothetical protein
MLTFTQLLNLSQQSNAMRYRAAASGASTELGSPLGLWGSRHAALRTAISLVQELPNQLDVTLKCHPLELL